MDVAPVPADDEARVVEVHDLLTRSFPAGQVEDRASFLDTVSPTAEPGAVPVVIAASNAGRVFGAAVGAYMPRVNAAMALYAAVQQEARGRGLYGAMRIRLVELLDAEAREAGHDGLDYVMSEVERGGRLYLGYVEARGAYPAPCEYWQPEAQGLSARPLELMLQPARKAGPETRDELAGLVSEIYTSIYRLADPGEDPSYRRVIQSIDMAPAGDSSR